MGKPQHLQDNRGTERRFSDKGSEPRKELNFRYKRQRPNRFKDFSQLYPCSAETTPASSNTCVEKWHYWPKYGIFQAKCYTGFHYSCLHRIPETGKSFCKPVFAHKHITLPSKEKITVRYKKNRTIARWRHLTTTTRILEFVVFLCKLRLLFFNPQWDWEI